MSITIYGSSDDLIEVEGDIREEFSAYGEDEYLVTSNVGAVMVTYDDDGVWRIKRLAGDTFISQAPVDDENDYSDICTLEGYVRWVAHGNTIHFSFGQHQ